MKKLVRGMVAIVLTVAMAFGGIEWCGVRIVEAAPIDIVSDGTANLALGKSYTLSSGTSTEGDGSITDGDVDAGKFLTPTKGVAGSWYTIDLGDIYEADGIDSVCVWYRLDFGGCYPGSGGFEIQYSVDGYVFETVATVSQSNFNSQKSGQAAPFVIQADIPDSISCDEVRYVRVYYPNSIAYGAQTSEVGIFDTDGDAKISDKVVNVDNPASVLVESTEDVFGQIRFSVTAGANQEGYRYLAFLDDNEAPILVNLSAGTQYNIDGISAGVHTLRIVSSYQGRASTGIVSSPVTVYDYESYVSNPEKNVCYFKEFTIFPGEANEGYGSITNGIISGGTADYICPVFNTTGTGYTVDLGNVYDASTLDKAIVWYRTTVGGCYPTGNGTLQIQFSTDNTNFNTVATLTAADVSSALNAHGNVAPFKVVADVSSATGDVRYVRFYYPEAVAYGAQATEVAVLDMNGDLSLSGNAVNVPQATSLVASSEDYNEIDYSFEGQQGYTYDILVVDQQGNNSKRIRNAQTSGTLDGIVAGTYKIAVVTVDSQGVQSEPVYSGMLTVSKAEQLSDISAVEADGEWHPIGGYSYRIDATNSGGTVAVDSGDADHVQTKFTFSTTDGYDSVQLKKSYSGLIAGETYKMQIKFYSFADGGSYRASGMTQHFVKLGTEHLELSAVSDEDGDVYFIFDLGRVASGVTLDFSEPVLKDWEGNDAESFETSLDISVVGFQMRTNGIGGNVAFRTVCKAPNIGSSIDVSGNTYTVAGFGTIYTLDPNPSYDKTQDVLSSRYTLLNPTISKDPNGVDAYVGYYKYNDVNYTYGYLATAVGVVSDYNKEDTTHTYYVRTMEGIDSAIINRTLHVRAFVLATDGTIIYSDKTRSISVAEVAAYIYDHSLAPNYYGHTYLYSVLNNASLIGATSPYYRNVEVEYGWNENLYTPGEKETVSPPQPEDETDDSYINEEPEF
ncbi:MAG: discoidin domain-containing protein [Lachnospiraceae bacterium]|nr:discoidin domain-containing protein [Lachnospiraceae bacterium]